MKAKRYRPDFFEGWEDEVICFNTLEELINTSWVTSFSNHPNFYRFSISRKYAPSKSIYLMAEYDNGRKWYVVAIISEYDLELLKDLPEWVAVKDEE